MLPRHDSAIPIVDRLCNVPLSEYLTLAGTVFTAAGAENIATNSFLAERSLINYAPLIQFCSASNSLVCATNRLKNPPLKPAPGASFSITLTTPHCLTNSAQPDNDAKVNRVYISKVSQPDAVPFLQFLDCGSGTKSILRILSVRDAVFVLKEDGIFRITGTDTSNFIQEAHDNTTRIVGPNTAVALANAVFFMSEAESVPSVSGHQ
jgi:hypothetical protein